MSKELNFDGIEYDDIKTRIKQSKQRKHSRPLGRSSDVNPGWVVKYLQRLVEESRVMVPLSNCRVTVTDGPRTLNYPSGSNGLNSLINAGKISVQGSSVKAWSKGEAPAVPGVVNVDLLANQCFAYVVRISDPVNYCRHGELSFALTFDQGGATPRTFNFGVVGSANIYEFLVLAFTSNGGIGEVGRSQGLRFSIDTTAQPVNDGTFGPPTAFTLETVNEYDLNVK
jgi:hypothetical protein